MSDSNGQYSSLIKINTDFKKFKMNRYYSNTILFQLFLEDYFIEIMGEIALLIMKHAKDMI